MKWLILMAYQIFKVLSTTFDSLSKISTLVYIFHEPKSTILLNFIKFEWRIRSVLAVILFFYTYRL